MNRSNEFPVLWTAGDLGSLLFPQRCPLCDGVLPFRARIAAPLPPPGKPDVWTHAACYHRLSFVSGLCCARCGRPFREERLPQTEQGALLCEECRGQDASFLRNLPLWLYDDITRDSIAAFKYRGRQQYALYYAREWMRCRGPELMSLKPDALIPVPIHRSRLVKRGYNQAALFAQALSRLSDIPCREDILIRSKHTDAQKSLSRSERLRNMKNAFRIEKDPKDISCAVLVDDIYTTGSTLRSLSDVLLAAGVRKIYALTLCIVPFRAEAGSTDAADSLR